MNRLRKTVLLAGLLLAAAAVAGVAQPRPARTATVPTGRTITVTGNGSVTTVPDRASFFFGVTTKAASAKDALARNSNAANAVIAALKSAGVASADLQTIGVSLSPQTTPDGTTIVGYTASNSVRARIGLDKAGALVDAAVAAGADSVSGPSLDTSDQNSLYQQALKQAVANARAKAQTLADAAGVTLGAVLTIDESGSPTPVPFGPSAVSGAASTPIEPGTQEVDATVTVVYAIG
jgi:uncharacterized protein YggE